MIFTGETVKPAVEDIIKKEVNHYLDSHQSDPELTILQWWKKNEMIYPRLSKLAKKYLAIPANSVPSERVFSLTGALVNKKRNRMNSKNIDLFVFLNKNVVS